MDQIRLMGMRFFGYHGVFEAERKLGQPFVVNVTLHLDLTAACASDRLSASVNYADVFERIRAQVEGSPVKLLERLAQRIADDLLGAYPQVDHVAVDVEKPNAPIPGMFAHIAVSILRGRGQ